MKQSHQDEPVRVPFGCDCFVVPPRIEGQTYITFYERILF
jgi:hypothetical protein